jgi:ribA/ribD-fused uncharacterized protein
MINEFRGQHSFLSNFHTLQNPIKVGFIEFPTSEHFYQAHKTLELIDRVWIAGLETPGDAKKAGSRRGLNGRKIQLRDDWENNDVKWNVMYAGLMLKFMGNYSIAASLTGTLNKKLVEGNWWHDNYWGDCVCDKCRHTEGENILGFMLMHFREKLNMIRI